tara:strand:- start:94 stop:360 length:267 start_codon:yes stop_codon:yes gene_type:complete
MEPRDTVHRRHLRLQREREIWRQEVWGEFVSLPRLSNLARTFMLSLLFASLVANVAQIYTVSTLSAKIDEITETAKHNGGWVLLDLAD